MESNELNYLESVKKQFIYYKTLGDKTITILTEEELHYTYNETSNSVAVIIKHIAGNMLSRWTNFLTEDGEKKWRHRDDEFEDTLTSKEEIVAYWEKGWTCLFKALDSVHQDNFTNLVYIRNQGHTITEAINRQLAHYPYHIGQMVFLGKMIKDSDWVSLSIPKNQSSQYNQEKFKQEKKRTHFTDDELRKLS
ncbi:hypothetical protein NBRC110019_06760 [Neptunitalea chrysea]|uniref:DUF1572 domain-containing protein n=1 Tax=Neptunitalea chrysea TaxID=1647581 RepID=A0A9W6EUR1_9FLAO|nr:DUF1572 family protein [Neptunitalea chrysea]GLB51637.1 hypothetical protein NBRC110019_06760 [Neptunitalea chrysea]